MQNSGLKVVINDGICPFKKSVIFSVVLNEKVKCIIIYNYI